MLTPSNVGENDYGYAAYITWIDAAGQSHKFFPDLVVSEQWTHAATGTEHPVEQGANVIDHVRVELSKCTLTIFATNEPIGANNFDDPGAPQTVSLAGPESPGVGTSTTAVQASVWNNNLTARGIAVAAGDLAATAIAGSIGGEIGGIAGAATIIGAGLLEGLLLSGSASVQSVPVSAGSLPAPQVLSSATVQYFAETEDYVAATVQLLQQLRDTGQVVSVFGSKQTLPSMIIESFSYTREETTGTGADIVLSLKEVRFVQTSTVNVPLPAIPSAASAIAKGNQNPAPAPAPAQQSVATLLKQLIQPSATSLLGGL